MRHLTATRLPRVLLLPVLMTLCPAAAPGETPPPPEAARALQEAFIGVHERIIPSVVSVRSLAAIPDDPREETNDASNRSDPAGWVVPVEDARYPGHVVIGSASGFVLDAGRGIIATTRSALLGEDDRLPVAFDVEGHDRIHAMALMLGGEPTLDLLFLKIMVPIDGRPPDLSAITWGESDQLQPGALAFLVGDPPGIDTFFTPTVLSGIPRRDCSQENLQASYLQISNTIHPEALGGPVTDLEGKVVGMLMPRWDRPGIDPGRQTVQFALPSKIIREIAAPIIHQRSVDSPWLGFSVMSREELREEVGPRALSRMSRPPVGIYIENVFEPSPAFAAGIRPGDFLTEFNGHPINSPIEFQKQFYLAGTGASVEVKTFRDGRTRSSIVAIGTRPQEANRLEETPSGI
ncbi:MAG: trypsin-like peptidase domain-containing protein [Planctomycetota bacterium]|nr:trypsin-like peptidase domain-containing protein [Planctomycetota bacterium]